MLAPTLGTAASLSTIMSRTAATPSGVGAVVVTTTWYTTAGLRAWRASVGRTHAPRATPGRRLLLRTGWRALSLSSSLFPLTPRRRLPPPWSLSPPAWTHLPSALPLPSPLPCLRLPVSPRVRWAPIPSGSALCAPLLGTCPAPSATCGSSLASRASSPSSTARCALSRLHRCRALRSSSPRPCWGRGTRCPPRLSAPIRSSLSPGTTSTTLRLRRCRPRWSNTSSRASVAAWSDARPAGTPGIGQVWVLLVPLKPPRALRQLLIARRSLAAVALLLGARLSVLAPGLLLGSPAPLST